MKEYRRIILIGLMIMAVLTLCAGIMVYYVMQLQSEDFLNRGLVQALQLRVENVTTVLQHEINKANTIATRPLLIEQYRRYEASKAKPEVRAIFQRAAQSFLPQGFSAIAFYDRDGEKLSAAGEFSEHPRLVIKLDTVSSARLIQDKTVSLRVDEDIMDGQERIGRVSTEAPLPTIDRMFSAAGSLGKTAEVALCAPLDRQDMACFSTALTPHVFPRIHRVRNGNTLPMSYALDGRSGVVHSRDYRDRDVVAAYSPLNGLGLGMVLKIDTGELYGPIHARLESILLALSVLLICGALLLRWQVLPLLKRLVRSERDARESHDRLLASDAHIRVLTEVSPVGIFRTDEAGDCIFVNDRYCEITGLSQSAALGKGWANALFAEDKDRVFSAWYESVQKKLPFSVECRYPRANGAVTWVLAQTAREIDEAGGTRGYVGSIIDITERKRAEGALRENEERYRSVVTVLSEGIIIQDDSLAIVACNPSAERILGLTEDQLTARTLADSRWRTIREDGSPFANEDYPAVVTLRTGKAASNVIMGVYRGDGSLVWISINTRALIRPGEWKPYAAVASFIDITDRKQAVDQMGKLSKVVEQTADAVIITDPQGVIEYVNAAFETITGFSREEVVGQTPRLIKSNWHKPDFYKQMWRKILKGEIFNDVFVNRRRDGSLYYEEKTITPLKDAAGKITHYVSTGKDITERMHIQDKLQYMAQYDALTNLPNKMLLLDRLNGALVRARRHRRLLALMFMDLDRFKNINDSLGHEAGDQLLKQLSDRLRRCVRDGDTVARFGGDEFVIFLDDVALENNVREMALKVLAELAEPFQVNAQLLYITASIGISLYPHDGDDSGTLLKNADIAMYRAKELGKNTYQFYSADMSVRAFERLTLETSLRHALERGEFRVHYQPQVDVSSGKCIGVEALLRWQHPEFGVVMPGDFMPLLEETGLIVPVGEWVLKTACAQLRGWQDAGQRGLRLAVNLSARQFSSDSLVACLERLNPQFGGDLSWLELEITESVLMGSAQTTTDILSRLSEMGCRFAIDDFGTGYSSLSYLKRFPINVLKIDRSFVRDIPDNKDDAAIVSTIIAMGHNLNLEVIAEGVETEDQLRYLRECGCDGMQGYLVSHPLPAEEVIGYF